jgi:hypothetical protein
MKIESAGYRCVVPVPFPSPETADLTRPGAAEAAIGASGVLSASRLVDGNTEFQRLLVEAAFAAMTGHEISSDDLPVVGSDLYAERLALRGEAYRMRMVHMMVLAALVLRPIPIAVADRVSEFSRALGIDDRLLETVRSFAASDHALTSFDFERNGYTSTWSDEQASVLHAGRVGSGWDKYEDDAALADRWRSLDDLPDDSLGKAVHRFYQSRGFSVPGTAGSAPPLLAQHDWVHVLADYGTKVEAELEVFAFIARANDDPRGFSLLAMAVSLFETGNLSDGAGLFEAFPGQLSRDGMAVRIADAMRRGALSHGLGPVPDVDFMAVDWFELAPRPMTELRRAFGVVAKSDEALAAGSVGPWEPGGISEFQRSSGVRLAAEAGVDYESFGATP